MKSKIELIHVFMRDKTTTVYRVFYKSGKVKEYETNLFFGMPETVYKFMQSDKRTLADTANGKTVIYYE